MPELPEVETVCRGLNLSSCKQELMGGEVLLERSIAYPSLADNSADLFTSNLVGLSIEKWSRRGKYLVAKLVDKKLAPAGYLVVHLRMTGQLFWLTQDVSVSKHTRVRLFFQDLRELRFVDTRTFGKIWLVPTGVEPESIVAGIKSLGVEPLSKEFKPDYLMKKLANVKGKIKSVLLDQTLIAGIGNIYADEALFVSKIHPQTLANSLNDVQLENLHQAIISVLEKGIEQGGTTIKDFRTVTGINGNYGGVAWVYGRTQKECRICKTLIKKIKLAGRSSHFCPQCQPEST